MTEEESREMTRSNYAAQMEMLGCDNGGNPLDMVHVVRCKDCEYRWDPIGCPMYSVGMQTEDNWYCADGKRR